jgi:hypothetical protein
MATTSTVKIKLDDLECGIASSSSSGFTFQDAAGNEVSISLRAVLRCLSIAEAEKLVPALPSEFWSAVEHHQ